MGAFLTKFSEAHAVYEKEKNETWNLSACMRFCFVSLRGNLEFCGMVWLFIFLYSLLEPCICKLSELLDTWNPRSSSAFFLNFFFNWLTKFYLKPCHTNVPVQVTEGTWEIDSIGIFIFSALLIFEINLCSKMLFLL